MRSPDRTRYRIVAISLRPDDIVEADRIVNALRDEGWPHANRSLVMREALAALTESLRGRSSEEIFRQFIDRRGRRIPSQKPDPTAA
jgi:hypothetical protein